MTTLDFVQLPGNALENLYVNGCQASYTSTTTATIAAGQVRDSTNSFDIVVSSPLVVNFATNGANGLDTGTFAASTSYYLFVLFDQTQANSPVALASTSATAPLMPSLNGVTFSHFRLVGFVRSDGSTHLLPFYVIGKQNVQHYQWDAPITVLNAGAATTATSVGLNTAVPVSNFGRVQLQLSYIPHAAGETASIKPAGATANTFTFSGIVASVQQDNVVEIIPLLVQLSSTVPGISYILSVGTSPAALTIKVTGFELNL